jgi:uncharacterized protein (DUF1330 family)
MRHYTVAEIDVTGRGWAREYVENVTPLVESYGGRYLARTPNFEKLEGDREPPQLFLIIEWPSKQAADDFYASDEYRPYRDRRQRGARNELVLVAGEDVNGLARGLP